METESRLETRLILRHLLRLIAVGGAALVIFWAMNPGMSIGHLGYLFKNTTPNGGDMGAHVWGPAFLRDELLKHGRISGWAPDWFAGFPALHFYFPFPSLLIVVVNAIHIPFTNIGIPYNVAFKLVTVLGPVSMPVSAYIMARCFGLKSPKPELLALSVMTFVFNTSFTIYGGNIASTLAGEFSFAISLSASLIFIGLFWQVLTTGKYRTLCAVFLAITVTSHILPTIFALVVVILMYLFHLDFSQSRRTQTIIGIQVSLAFAGFALSIAGVGAHVLGLRLGIFMWLVAVAMIPLHTSAKRFMQSIIVGGVGVAITCIWLLPFKFDLYMSNDMGWTKETKYFEWIVKGPMHFAIPLAIIGLILSIARNNRLGILLGMVSVAVIAGFVLAPQAQLWNARALPFWYLTGTLLAAIGVGELLEICAEAWDNHYSLLPAGTDLSAVSLIGVSVAFIVTIVLVAGGMGLVPKTVFGLDIGTNRLNSKAPSFVQGWAKWNYEGYEKKPAYPEYKAVIDAMRDVGKEYGCGRAMWEYEPQEDRFGTPMALMLLPYWTNHCIGSEEGLYFESAASAPYHWIIQDQMSVQGSDPQQNLPYQGHNIDLGTKHLQSLGTRYYMAITPSSQEAAAANPDLTLIKTLPTFNVSYDAGPAPRNWQIYMVKDSDLVTPLANQPVVAKGPTDSRTGWLEMAMRWYTNQDEPNALLGASDPSQVVYFTDSGPSSWQRSAYKINNPPEEKHAFYDPVARSNHFGDAVSWAETDPKPLPTVSVTDVKQDDDDISFHVDKVGVPVLVRMSYFPNWKVSGAKGVYRSTPNFMVVVPTSHTVHLHYGRTAIDWLGLLFTAFGIIALFVLHRAGRVQYPEIETDYYRATRSYPSESLVTSDSASMIRSLPEFLVNGAKIDSQRSRTNSAVGVKSPDQSE